MIHNLVRETGLSTNNKVSAAQEASVPGTNGKPARRPLGWEGRSKKYRKRQEDERKGYREGREEGTAGRETEK